MKVEETGFFSGLSTRPFIRLRGRWLQRAGFQPGSHVVIEVIRPGELKILAKTKETLVKRGLKPEQVTTEIAKERGNIAPQILQAAADHKCDTIVVGRRGGSMVAAFLLGSVVEHLLRNPVGFAIWVVE